MTGTLGQADAATTNLSTGGPYSTWDNGFEDSDGRTFSSAYVHESSTLDLAGNAVTVCVLGGSIRTNGSIPDGEHTILTGLPASCQVAQWQALPHMKLGSEWLWPGLEDCTDCTASQARLSQSNGDLVLNLTDTAEGARPSLLIVLQVPPIES